MGFSKHDIRRDSYMLTGKFRKQGYDWWWHSFTGRNTKTGEEKAFFFEFFTCNPARAEASPTFGQLAQNKQEGKFPSYLMIKAGAWGEDACQLHRFFAWGNVKIKKDAPFSVKAGDCELGETFSKGSICVSKEDAAAHPEYMCDSGEISWNLKIQKIVPFNVGFGADTFFRNIHAFQMYWHAEGMKSLYSGEVIFNGEKYEIVPETSFGYADKNWGSNFTTPWVWLSSNDLISRKTGERLQNSVFDIGGGKPKVFFVSLPRKLLGAFYYEGKEYEFNFSKFWTFCKTEFDCKETEDEIVWNVRQETLRAVMKTEIHCKKSDMLLVNYEAPDGMKKHNRLWNGGNGKGMVSLYTKKHRKLELIDTVDVGHVGCEYGEMDK